MMVSNAAPPNLAVNTVAAYAGLRPRNGSRVTLIR